MNFKKELWEEKFRTLSVRFGGNILKEREKLPQNNHVVVFIGLGGLGGMAVNEIKATASERLADPENRFYLVVDSCRSDMNLISADDAQDLTAKGIASACSYPHGCITQEEKMPLYSAAHKIGAPGPHVDTWINRDAMRDVTVDDRGAMGIRQVGRVMLLGDLDEYENNVKKLTAILTKAQTVASTKNLDMKIYIIAGVGGGTGSGTVVDFTYMVRKAIQHFPLAHRKVEGIIFTPDVQEHDIEDKNYYRNIVCRNFYAAMKEIDYYFNNRARGKAYVCPVGMQQSVYKEDIFDECTLVSRLSGGVQIASNAAGVIRKLADAIVFELGGIKGELSDGTRNQSYDSFYSNLPAFFHSWWMANNGNMGMQMPDFLPYRYSSLGYASFYIPRDEILSYCANRLLERLIDQWTKNDVTNEDIDALMRKAHLFDLRQFAAKLFQSSGAEDAFCDVDEREKPVDGLGLLPVKNCAKYLEKMAEIARQESSPNAVVKKLGRAERTVSADFVSILLKAVDDAFTDEKGRGPVYAINLLSANSISCKGVLRRLAAMLDCTIGEADAWADELNTLYAQLRDKAGQYDGKFSLPPAELAAFTASCEAYAKAHVMAALLRRSGELLKKIFDELNNKNNRVFEIYTWTFDFLRYTLKQDSEYILNAKRRKEGHVTSFSFDLADFGQNDPLSNLFKEYFDSYVDEMDMDDMSREFIHGIFGAMKDLLDHEYWEPDNVKPEQVIAILRAFFTGAFSEFTLQAIEKFCVIAYGNIKLTPQQLSFVFDTSEDLNSKEKLLYPAIWHAANMIESRLREAKIMPSGSDPSRSAEMFSSYKAVYAPAGTKYINNFLYQSHLELPADLSAFIAYKRIFGFPIGLLESLREYREIYNNNANVPGVHLNEVEDWRTALPELYDYRLARFLRQYCPGGDDPTERDIARMKKILAYAQKAKALGLLQVRTVRAQTEFFWSDNNRPEKEYYALTYRTLRPISDEEEVIEWKLSNVLRDTPDLDFLAAISAAGYAPDDAKEIRWCYKRPEYNVMGDIESMTDFGDENDFGNFITLIRSNYEWEQMLYGGVELFGMLKRIYDSVKDR